MPAGQFDFKLHTVSANRWPQSDKGDRIVFPILRLKRDRRTGLQIRDRVIPQQHRSVKTGGKAVNANSPRCRLHPALTLDEITLKSDHSPNQHRAVIFESLDQIGILSAEPAGMRTPA